MNKDGIVVMCTGEHSLLIREMGLAICNGSMGHIIKDSGRMEYKMGMVSSILTKLDWLKANLLKTN